jgi:TonB family protein
MLFIYRGALVAALLAASLIGGSVVPGLNAQESSSSSSRRVKSKVPPLYPELARKMNVSGKVRLNVTVAPNGQVTKSEVLGGHPVLANAAKDAVKKWKYEPASQETQVTVEFDFGSLGG